MDERNSTNEAPEGEPQKRSGGPPKGSTNAIRHGMMTSKLPKKLEWVEKKANAFRRRLEAAVEEAKGDITLTDAATINTAVKWERHAMLAQAWLREQEATLSASDRLRFSEAIAKASDNRDRNIRQLGLDSKPVAPWVV